jgi:tetratricopeptide (TPR) repeat protein
MAEKPYFIENISTNAFSIEEICYFMYHNPALLDSSIINTELCEWFSKELGLTRLGQVLERALADNRSLMNFVLPIFREISYLSLRETQIFSENLTELARDSVPVRLKKKGDALVRYGKEGSALKAYRQVLNADDGSMEAPFLSQVWHNMGVANMRMLQYEDGLECFGKAYGLLHTKKELTSYLYAFALTKPREKYEEALKDLRVDDRTAKEIQTRIDAANEAADEEVQGDPDAFLQKLTTEYHRSTDT